MMMLTFPLLFLWWWCLLFYVTILLMICCYCCYELGASGDDPRWPHSYPTSIYWLARVLPTTVLWLHSPGQPIILRCPWWRILTLLLSCIIVDDLIDGRRWWYCYCCLTVTYGRYSPYSILLIPHCWRVDPCWWWSVIPLVMTLLVFVIPTVICYSRYGDGGWYYIWYIVGDVLRWWVLTVGWSNPLFPVIFIILFIVMTWRQAAERYCWRYWRWPDSSGEG